MIRWMLEQLVHSPAAVFQESELVDEFPDQFQWAKDARLIRFAGWLPALNSEDGRRRTIYGDGPDRFAIIDDDPDVVFESVTQDDVRAWFLDLTSLADRLRAANGLAGGSEAVDQHLVFVGASRRDAFVLALATAPQVRRLLVDGRPAALREYERIFAICPGLGSKPSLTNALFAANVAVLPLPSMASLANHEWLLARPDSAQPQPGARRRLGQGGGRPSGMSIGSALHCWFSCYRLADKLGSTRAAYDAVERYFTKHPDAKVVLIHRDDFRKARSAAAERQSKLPCRWYRHSEGLPSELLSE